MAQQTQVLLIDDLDGGDADETVTFALDGTAYEIDLSTKNATVLRNALDKYVAKARRAGRTTTRASSAARPARTRSSAARNATIRSWARLQGLEVSDRGRISADVVEKWKAAGRPGE
jgi:hypothetical protein